jgi:type IV secretion system protein VirB1
MDLSALVQQCAADVHPTTMAAVVKVESSANPFAIGVVGGRLERQPRSKAEAISTAHALERAGWNFSLGQAQVNRRNLAKYNLTYDSAFEPCANLRAGAAILKECYTRALRRTPSTQGALQGALSCYYSGNFSTGFKAEGNNPSYVAKVLASAGAKPVPVVPAPLAAIPVTGQPGAAKAKAQERVEASTSVMPISIAERAQPSRSKPSHSSATEYDGFDTARESPGNPYDGFAQQVAKPEPGE